MDDMENKRKIFFSCMTKKHAEDYEKKIKENQNISKDIDSKNSRIIELEQKINESDFNIHFEKETKPSLFPR